MPVKWKMSTTAVKIYIFISPGALYCNVLYCIEPLFMFLLIVIYQVFVLLLHLETVYSTLSLHLPKKDNGITDMDS